MTQHVVYKTICRQTISLLNGRGTVIARSIRKVAELVGVAGDQGYVQGAKLRCKLKEGIFFAILLATGLCLCACISIYIANIGNRSECVAAQNRLEKETGKLHIWVKSMTLPILHHTAESSDDDTRKADMRLKEKEIQPPCEALLLCVYFFTITVVYSWCG